MQTNTWIVKTLKEKNLQIENLLAWIYSMRRDYIRDQREWISLRSKVGSLNIKEIPKAELPKNF